jgi:hypothetical protein
MAMDQETIKNQSKMQETVKMDQDTFKNPDKVEQKTAGKSVSKKQTPVDYDDADSLSNDSAGSEFGLSEDEDAAVIFLFTYYQKAKKQFDNTAKINEPSDLFKELPEIIIKLTNYNTKCNKSRHVKIKTEIDERAGDRPPRYLLLLLII